MITLLLFLVGILLLCVTLIAILDGLMLAAIRSAAKTLYPEKWEQEYKRIRQRTRNERWIIK